MEKERVCVNLAKEGGRYRRERLSETSMAGMKSNFSKRYDLYAFECSRCSFVSKFHMWMDVSYPVHECVCVLQSNTFRDLKQGCMNIWSLHTSHRKRKRSIYTVEKNSPASLGLGFHQSFYLPAQAVGRQWAGECRITWETEGVSNTAPLPPHTHKITVCPSLAWCKTQFSSVNFLLNRYTFSIHLTACEVSLTKKNT